MTLIASTGCSRSGINESPAQGAPAYRTLVADHQRRQIVWAAEGTSATVADEFLRRPSRAPSAAQIAAVSMDIGPRYAKSTRAHAPQAVA